MFTVLTHTGRDRRHFNLSFAMMALPLVPFPFPRNEGHLARMMPLTPRIGESTAANNPHNDATTRCDVVVPSCRRHEDGGRKGGGKCQSVCLPRKISVGIGRGKFGKKSKLYPVKVQLSPGKVWSAPVKVTNDSKIVVILVRDRCIILP